MEDFRSPGTKGADFTFQLKNETFNLDDAFSNDDSVVENKRTLSSRPLTTMMATKPINISTNIIVPKEKEETQEEEFMSEPYTTNEEVAIRKLLNTGGGRYKGFHIDPEISKGKVFSKISGKWISITNKEYIKEKEASGGTPINYTFDPAEAYIYKIRTSEDRKLRKSPKKNI